MSIVNNINLIHDIDSYLSLKLPVGLGVNKKNETIRLIYEICSLNGATIDELAEAIGLDFMIEEGKGGLFQRIKKALVEVRYPSKIYSDDPHIMPLKIKETSADAPIWDYTLSPKRIFIEESVSDEIWTREFVLNFPEVEIIPINKLNDAFRSLPKDDDVKLYNLRRDNVVINRNKAAFTKMCPCTKNCYCCGYWVLNVGFGCPIDCSYCYLQMYSNAPGIILPANIEEYQSHINELDKKINTRIRIGTGEFTDSLALDKYTNYSKYLIPYFKDTKNLILELKTKEANIPNVLEQEAHDNVLISWSINVPHMAEKYEQGASPVQDRIASAKEAASKGYKIGFHFDPIVYYENWEEDYKSIVKELFSHKEIKANTKWISLGTLRYTPGLKQLSENRFSDSKIFYSGEFFSGFDEKLRYPRNTRVDIYNKMIEWIRSYDTSCWIYLCMEPKDVWQSTNLTKKDYSFWE